MSSSPNPNPIILSLGNIKGGTGKTTANWLIGQSLAMDHRFSVLMVDLDMQADLTRLMLGKLDHEQLTIADAFRDVIKRRSVHIEDYAVMQPYPVPSIIPSSPGLNTIRPDTESWSGPKGEILQRMLVDINGLSAYRHGRGFDFILIDTAPSNTVFTLNAWMSAWVADSAVYERAGEWPPVQLRVGAVCTPSMASIKNIAYLKRYLEEVGIDYQRPLDIDFILCSRRHRRTHDAKYYYDRLRSQDGIPVCPRSIPEASAIERAQSRGEDLRDITDKRVRDAVADISAWIAHRCGKLERYEPRGEDESNEQPARRSAVESNI